MASKYTMDETDVTLRLGNVKMFNERTISKSVGKCVGETRKLPGKMLPPPRLKR